MERDVCTGSRYSAIRETATIVANDNGTDHAAGWE